MKILLGEGITSNGRGEAKKLVGELIVARTDSIQLLKPNSKILCRIVRAFWKNSPCKLGEKL